MTSRVEGTTPYRVAAPVGPIDLKLDGNEGPVPPRSLLAAAAEIDPEVVRRYPDASALEATLARRFDVDPRRVLVTAGADDAIDRFCRALPPGRSIIAPSPTFEMLPRYAALSGLSVVAPAWPAGAYPIESVLASIDERTAAVAVVTPNNPTGAVATPDDLLRVATYRSGSWVLADFAYAEFADDDLTPVATALPNAVVLRTFSKAWGLAGLRVGYAIGPPDFVTRMRAAGAPYAVSSLSLALAASALERGEEAMRAFVSRVRRERALLAERLGALGAEALPSQANFVLARFGDAEGVRAALARRGIAVRSFPGRADLKECLRITCPGRDDAFERLSRVLEETCR